MANWAKWRESETGLPVVKRAERSIHFRRPDGLIQAEFSGKPCHYKDALGIWRQIDTDLVELEDGYFGAGHSDVIIHKNGKIKVKGSDYEQFTELPGNPFGKVRGDRIIRKFAGGEQHLIMTEDGFKQEIHVTKKKIPVEKFIAKSSGNLPAKYHRSVITAEDAGGNVYEFTGDTVEFGTWLDNAMYPVVIDPDFGAGAAGGYIEGNHADYATARSTSTFARSTNPQEYIGQTFATTYYCDRIFLLFDTSSIDDGVTVSQVNLTMTRTDSDAISNAFDVQIVKQDWSGQTNYSSNATNREIAFDTCLTADLDDSVLWSSSTGWTANAQKTAGNLSTSWINKTGTTYYSLVSSRDRAGTSPGSSGTIRERVRLALSENTTEAYRPKLSVLYLVSVDLTAADFTLSPVTFDAPVLTNVSSTVDLTAKDFTLNAVTFDAPTLTNVWVTPASRTYAIESESRTLTIGAESRMLAIQSEMRGLKITSNSELKYEITRLTYNGLTAKDFTLSAPTFDAPYLNYSITGNAGVADATVTFGVSSTTSGADGSYRFDGLAAGTKGTVTVTKTGYEFYPQRKYIHTMSADVAQNFTATQMTTTYYVRTDGNDTTGDGSNGAPWLTLTKACNTVALTGAAYIKVGTGTYTDTGLPSKSYTGLVVIEPESGTLGDVIISSAATSNFVLTSLANVRFRKLDFEEGANVTNWNILFTEGVISNIDFIDCQIARNTSTSGARGNLLFNSTTATNIIIDGCDFPVSQNTPAAVEVSPRTSMSNLIVTGCTFPESTGGTTYYSAISVKCTVGVNKFVDNVEISNLTITDLKHSISIYIGDDLNAQSPITNVNMYDCTVTGDNHVVAFEFGVDGALIDRCTVNAVGTYGFVIKESDDVEISNCTVNSGTNSAIYFKACRTANAHHNTITAAQGYGFRLANNLAPDPDTKCSDWLFQNNTINVSGTGKALIIGNDDHDSGGGICDYNTYQNNSGLGAVRNDADVQSLAELQAAWADYDVTTNDAHSTVI